MAPELRQVLLPLALAQFICSFAGSNMNVMINDISEDLDTTVQGVQVAITVFLLVMAALMIPAGKLTDRWGRRRCFTLGLMIYGVGALMSAVAPGLGVLIIGNSILEGVGTALLIPPVGIGAAAGPLIGGVITEAMSWRAAFVFQALVVGLIILLSRRVVDPVAPDPTRPFDLLGAFLSAGGLVLLVAGILAADDEPSLMALLVVAAAGLLGAFFWHSARMERHGREPLLSPTLFRNRSSDLGLVTQNVQWLLLMGTSFVVSAYLQVVRGYDAIQTGVIFTAATGGILVSSLAAERLARRFEQRTLIIGGFVVTLCGIAALLLLVPDDPGPWRFAPGLLFVGLGLGVMLTPSVNVVQSAFPDQQQGEISGLSRSISNLGSSLGTAVAGTILVSGLADGGEAYGLAMAVLGGIGLVGLVAGVALPRRDALATDDPAAAPR
jgi:MFS family permease